MPASYRPTFDRALPHRIKKFLETHRYADVDTVTEGLQKLYRHDYGRRKRNVFRQVVKGELENLGGFMDKLQIKVESDSSYDDGKEYVEYQDMNMMNRSLSTIYNKEVVTVAASPPRTPQSYDSPQKTEFKSDKGPYQDARNKEDANPISNSESPIAVNNNGIPPNKEDEYIVKDLEQSKKKVSNTFEDKTISDSEPRQAKRKANKITAKSKTKKSSKKRKLEDQNEGDILPPTTKKFELENSEVTFADLAGNEAALEDLSRLLLHLSHQEIYTTLGVTPPRGILLYGPPGCGKTLLGNAIAGQLNMPIIRLVGPQIIGGVSGESEKTVREVFELAVNSAPCILFIDEIDSIGQKRDNSSKEMEKRIVTQLLSCLDNLNRGTEQVMVIGATNRPDNLDPALRRAGRFDREICLGIPDEKARRKILQVLCKKLKIAEDLKFDLIARLTPGYVGADLLSLCREAAMRAVTRILQSNLSITNNLDQTSMLDLLQNHKPISDEALEGLFIETSDFELATGDVQPSAKREGFATVPDVTWEDVGSLEEVREELSIAILGPVRNPEAFSALGLSRASGILLAGPPGCGKTLLAKAIANESGINFVSVKGPELLNMYVGESERAVRQCFERARNSSPCVIFFDELDSLCPRRTSADTGSSARVVNQMLTELDGLESRKQVFVMAATNRPDIIDPAMLRPGRLDKTIYIGIPHPEDRVKILNTLTHNGTRPPLMDDVNLVAIAKDERCHGFTGADLSALVREASLNAVRKGMLHEWNNILNEDKEPNTNMRVSLQNFTDAFNKVNPSVSIEDRVIYENMRKGVQ